MLITELSAEARAIADLMNATAVGAVITYDAMTAAIGRNVRDCRHVIAAARRVSLRETGAVFASERSNGYRRIEAERVAVTVGPAARATIRRTARRARTVLVAGTERMNDMAPEAQRKLAAEVSALTLVEHLSRDAAVKPSEDGPTKPMPVALTARTMLGVLTGDRP